MTNQCRPTFFFPLLFTVACGTAAPGVPSISTEGGIFEFEGGRLEIPPGALDASIEFTARALPSNSLPEPETIRRVVDLGPTGTRFQRGVTLTLTLPAPKAEGERTVISWLDESDQRWNDLDSTGDAQTLQTVIEHLSTYAARVAPSAEMCEFMPPCGGDVTGTWERTAYACDEGKQYDLLLRSYAFKSDPNNCARTATVALGPEMFSEEITFDGTNAATSEMVAGRDADVLIPASCWAAVLDLPDFQFSCAQLERALVREGLACSGDPRVACHCAGKLIRSGKDPENVPYSTNGTSITTGSHTHGYCVKGNDMVVDFDDPDQPSAQAPFRRK